MFPTIPDKTYFKIGEAADLVDVKPYIIRYWESEFRALKPSKTKSQQRLFRRKDIELLLVIRALLYEHKFTTEGARQKLRELSEAGRTPAELLESLAQGEIPAVHVPPPAAPAASAAAAPVLDELRQANERLALQKRKLDDFAELLRAERAAAQKASREHAAQIEALRETLASRDATISQLHAQRHGTGGLAVQRALAALDGIEARLRSGGRSG